MAESKAWVMIPKLRDSTDDEVNMVLDMCPLVLCKECIHWDKHIEECGNPDSVCFRNGWCKPEWFCADGSRGGDAHGSR